MPLVKQNRTHFHWFVWIYHSKKNCSLFLPLGIFGNRFRIKKRVKHTWTVAKYLRRILRTKSISQY